MFLPLGLLVGIRRTPGVFRAIPVEFVAALIDFLFWGVGGGGSSFTECAVGPLRHCLRHKKWRCPVCFLYIKPWKHLHMCTVLWNKIVVECMFLQGGWQRKRNRARQENSDATDAIDGWMIYEFIWYHFLK